jgi:hypothetical protein
VTDKENEAATMTGSTNDRNPVEQLADEFAARLRRGEHPSLTEYTKRYPDLADDIREKYPPERFAPLRDEAIACMALPDLEQTAPSIRIPEGTVAFAFDAGMTRYALRLRDGTILVRSTGDDRENARFQGRGDREIYIFELSPNGRYLATRHQPDGAVTVWDVDHRAVVVNEQGRFGVYAARFSPDGKRVALGHDRGQLLLYDLPTGRLTSRLPVPAPRTWLSAAMERRSQSSQWSKKKAPA